MSWRHKISWQTLASLLLALAPVWVGMIQSLLLLGVSTPGLATETEFIAQMRLWNTWLLASFVVGFLGFIGWIGCVFALKRLRKENPDPAAGHEKDVAGKIALAAALVLNVVGVGCAFYIFNSGLPVEKTRWIHSVFVGLMLPASLGIGLPMGILSHLIDRKSLFLPVIMLSILAGPLCGSVGFIYTRTPASQLSAPPG